MSNSDEFLSQECYIYLPRLEGIDQATRLTRSKRLNNDIESESGSESSYRISSRMSRPSRKRGSGEVDEPHTNKAKGGPLSVKKVKFGLNYDPEKDNLSFKQLNPDSYSLITSIVKPTYSDVVSDQITFFLNKSKAKKIQTANYCVLLRLAYFNKQDGDYDDIFDYGMSIRVNDILFPLTAPTEDDPNAPLEGPADITRYLFAEDGEAETVKIVFEGQAKPHIYSLIFCKKVKDELPHVFLRHMMPKQTMKLYHLVYERYLTNPDKLFRKVLPLTDPVSKQRIVNPVRGQSCFHLECFDFDTFRRANRLKVTWSCPICSKIVKENEMALDGLFYTILAKTFSTCYSVELDSQGGWSPIYRDKVFRCKTVDLENDVSDEDEEPEDGEMRTPEGPLSPVDVPPEIEEPEVSLDSNQFHDGMNGGDEPMMSVSKEAETQTGQMWSPSFDNKSDSAYEAADPEQNEPSFIDVHDDQDTNEASQSHPTTVIQRIDDEDRSHAMDDAE